eukprot:5156974-Amphidinium_carterae.1
MTKDPGHNTDNRETSRKGVVLDRAGPTYPNDVVEIKELWFAKKRAEGLPNEGDVPLGGSIFFTLVCHGGGVLVILLLAL